MRFSWRHQKTNESIGSDRVHTNDDGINSSGLMTGVEKGFFEALLFTFSVILHLSHSLKGEHGAKL
jgi:hypothetical protein